MHSSLQWHKVDLLHYYCTWKSCSSAYIALWCTCMTFKWLTVSTVFCLNLYSFLIVHIKMRRQNKTPNYPWTLLHYHLKSNLTYVKLFQWWILNFKRREFNYYMYTSNALSTCSWPIVKRIRGCRGVRKSFYQKKALFVILSQFRSEII